MLVRVPVFVLIFAVASVFFGGEATAKEATNEEDATTVRTLLERLDKGEHEAWVKIAKLGWSRVAPHMAYGRIPKKYRQLAMEAVDNLAPGGQACFEFLLPYMRSSDEGLMGYAIELLAARLPRSLNRSAPDQPIRWNQSWWRPLLIVLHGLGVPEVAVFGTEAPFDTLARMLRDQVHGSEDSLLTLSTDQDWRVRMMATACLASTSKRRGIDVEQALRNRLQDKNPRVRQMAAWVVPQGDWKQFIPQLSQLMLATGEEKVVRLAAARGLSYFVEHDTASAFVKLARDADPEFRRLAIGELCHLGHSAAAFTTCLNALFDVDDGVRNKACQLTRWLDPPYPEAIDHYRDRLVGLLVDPNRDIRGCALQLLSSFRAVPKAELAHLLETLHGDGDRVDAKPKDDCRTTARVACIALASMGDAAKSELIRLYVLAARRTENAKFAQRVIDAIAMAPLRADQLKRLIHGPSEHHAVIATIEAARRKQQSLLLLALHSRQAPERGARGRMVVASRPHSAETTLRLIANASIRPPAIARAVDVTRQSLSHVRCGGGIATHTVLEGAKPTPARDHSRTRSERTEAYRGRGVEALRRHALQGEPPVRPRRD